MCDRRKEIDCNLVCCVNQVFLFVFTFNTHSPGMNMVVAITWFPLLIRNVHLQKKMDWYKRLSLAYMNC